MRRGRTQSLEHIWANRLGVDDAAGVQDELEARLENLSRNVLVGGLPAAGKASTAVAYGDLLELATFLCDARQVLLGKEVQR